MPTIRFDISQAEEVAKHLEVSIGKAAERALRERALRGVGPEERRRLEEFEIPPRCVQRSAELVAEDCADLVRAGGVVELGGHVDRHLARLLRTDPPHRAPVLG